MGQAPLGVFFLGSTSTLSWTNVKQHQLLVKQLSPPSADRYGDAPILSRKIDGLPFHTGSKSMSRFRRGKELASGRGKTRGIKQRQFSREDSCVAEHNSGLFRRAAEMASGQSSRVDILNPSDPRSSRRSLADASPWSYSP